MEQSKNNLKTLWNLMDGHRTRYLGALAAMFVGVGALYVTPLITRATIDGLIALRPGSDLSTPARFLADHAGQW
ncbi:MAG: hypothetical protein JWL69_4741, partial [Phycisphaerales bacterium]|nr:hypothetical protein [Phycisphaerales bacterium]